MISKSANPYVIGSINFSEMNRFTCDIIDLENLISIRIIVYTSTTQSLAYFHRCICDFHSIELRLSCLSSFKC